MIYYHWMSLLKKIKEHYNFSNEQFFKQEYNHGIGLYVVLPLDEEFVTEFDAEMRYNNYFLSSQAELRNKLYSLYEPIPQCNVNYFIKKNKYLYHYTQYKNLDNIMDKGLYPQKDKNPTYKYISPRLYFSLEENSRLTYSLYSNLKDKGISNDNHYVLLKIDIKKISKNINFYLDVYGYKSVFTQDKILPNAIKPIKECYINTPNDLFLEI